MSDQLERLEVAEDIIFDKLSGRISNDTFADKLSVVLSDTFSKKNFEVKIASNTAKAAFWGCAVLPNALVLEEIATLAVGQDKTSRERNDIVERWKNVNNWTIEIDGRTLGKELGLTPKEVLAVILHEIGHVVYDTQHIKRFTNAYREAKAQFRTNTQSSGNKIMSFLFTLPLYTSLTTHTNVSLSSLKAEKNSDRFVIDNGYGLNLDTALAKIIKVYGNTEFVKSEQEANNKLVTEITSTSIWVQDLVKRRHDIKDYLYYKTMTTNSPYLQTLCTDILVRLGHGFRENFTGSVIESAHTLDILQLPDFEYVYHGDMDIAKINAYESGIRNAVSSYKRKIATEAGGFTPTRDFPEHREIDEIAVDASKIKTLDDRNFVLDKIYDLLERIKDIEGYMESNPLIQQRYAMKVVSYKDELDELKSHVLNDINIQVL